MKKLTPILLAIFTQLIAQDQSVYTLTGEKDPRLDARYSISYVATNLKEGCGSRGYTTGTMKPSITQRSVSVPDGNYTINLPIYMTPEEDKKGCGYRFAGIDLTMKRKNDDDLYSKFQLLGDFKRYSSTQEPLSVYRGFKGGMGGGGFVGMNHKATPRFTSDKKYFRIVPETTFVCMTQHNVYEYDRSKRDKELSQKFGDTNFMCTIQMKLDTDGGRYHFNECSMEEQSKDTTHKCGSMTHPDFGVDEITSDTLHIDILVDESKCKVLRNLNRQLLFEVEADTFREVAKPASSALESVKSLF